MSDTSALAAVLAAHPPTYTEHATDPTSTFYCKPCSESIGDWVTWTPEHVAAALAPLMTAREQAAEQRGREDNADHGMCYVSGSAALAAREQAARADERRLMRDEEGGW